METRWWVWVALAGFVAGGALLAYAIRSVARSLPDDVRATARDAVRKRARLATVAGVVAAWTLVYALYSMSSPPGVRAQNADAPTTIALGPSAGPGPSVVSAPRPGQLPPRKNDDRVFHFSDDVVYPPLPPIGPPPGDGGPQQAACSAADQAKAIREAQAAAEALTGQPLGADLATLVEVAAGCGDAASAILALLGPVGEVMDAIGVLPDTIPLPAAPDLDLPSVPEPIAAPLRPAVFQACAQASAELVTVGALAPFFHLDYNQFVALLSTLDKICGTFAPPS